MNLREYLEKHPPQGFKPIPSVNITGNMLVWYWSDEEGYAESIHHDGVWIGSVIRSFKTKEAVGIKLFLESVNVNFPVDHDKSEGIPLC